VLQRLEKLNLVGGAIYDALIAQAALKAKAERLLTFNPSHFLRLGQDVEAVVLVPGKKA
jgi:predicted nucleic acid-binding protein